MKEKEIQLWDNYNNDKSIKNRNALSEYYYNLIERVATQLSSKLYNMEAEELITYGWMGLIDAIEKYNTESNASFTTFAFLCVKREMINGVEKELKSWRKDKPPISLDSLINENEEPIIIVEDRHDDFGPIDFMDSFNLLVEPLKEQEKEIAYKRFVEGKTLLEISQEMELTERYITNTMYQRIIPIFKDRASLMDDFRE